MICIKKHVNITTLLLIAALVSAIAYQAGASRTISPVQPTKVAVVNLPRVLEGLEQRGAAEMEVHAILAKINEERKSREDELRRLDTEFSQLRQQAQENPDVLTDAEAAAEQLELEDLRYRAWLQIQNEQVDIEHALVLQDLYRAVKRAAADMAESEGYDLVLVEDAEGELTINPEARVSRAAQIEQQMLSRLMLHVNPTIDITDDLIERMNNAYRAGGGQ